MTSTSSSTTTVIHRRNTNAHNKSSSPTNEPILPIHNNRKKKNRSWKKNGFFTYFDGTVAGVAFLFCVVLVILVVSVSTVTNEFGSIEQASFGWMKQHRRQREHRQWIHPSQNIKYQQHDGKQRKEHIQSSSVDVIPEDAVGLVVPSAPIRRVIGNTPTASYYDVVIAGAGPAGLTAALFASRAGLTVHVLGSKSQGLLSQSKQLDNFPSFDTIKKTTSNNSSGSDWLDITKAQAEFWGTSFGPPGLLVSSIERQRMEEEDSAKNVFFALHAGNGLEIRAWAVIVASGARPRTLGLPGEDKLWGVSLHNCAICDGHLYQASTKITTTVLVVGGGDAALDAALLLSRYAAKVILLHRGEDFTSAHNRRNLQLIRSMANIEIVTPYIATEWVTEDDDPSQLTGVVLSNTATSIDDKHIQINGAFVMIGATPNTGWTRDVGVALDEEGLIQTGFHTGTTSSSIPGLFAAGEVTDHVYKQAITAAAAGAQAAIDAERWLREHRGTAVTKNVASVIKSNPNPNPNKNSHETLGNDNENKTDDNCDLTSQDCVKSIIHKYPVVVFSKPWCPYCRKAMEALSLAGLPESQIHIIDLSHHSDTLQIQSTLQMMTGRRTVPNVFVGGTSIGGGDETVAFQREGNLVTLLREVGALTTRLEVEEMGKTEGTPILNKPSGKTEDSNDKTNADHSITESCNLSSNDCFHNIIQKYPVLMFSLSWCPECQQSLELLNRIGVSKDQIHIIDLDDYESIEVDIRLHMKNLTGRRSVPNLFVGGEFVGGFYQTNDTHEKGLLIPKFQKVGLL